MSVVWSLSRVGDATHRTPFDLRLSPWQAGSCETVEHYVSSMSDVLVAPIFTAIGVVVASVIAATVAILNGDDSASTMLRCENKLTVISASAS
jgi:hypothetical protein